jgi:hypothetical protein
MKKLLAAVFVPIAVAFLFAACSSPPPNPPDAVKTNTVTFRIAAPIDSEGVLTLKKDYAQWHHSDINSDPPGMHGNFKGEEKKTVINGASFLPEWKGNPHHGANISSHGFGPFRPTIPEADLTVKLRTPVKGVTVSSPGRGVVRIQYRDPFTIKVFITDVEVSWVSK